MSDRFPVVGELFRHPEIADRLPGAAVSIGKAFTILTEGTKSKGRGISEDGEGGVGEETYIRGHFRAVVCMPFAIAARIR